MLQPTAYDHPDAVLLTDLAQQYYQQLYGGADTNPIAPEQFVAPYGQFLVGYLEGAAVAMGGWRLLYGAPPIPARRPAEIRRMFVRAELRRRGLGRALLVGLEASAAASGVDVLLLETGRPQVDAVALYYEAGYVDVPAFGYWAGAEFAVHLARRLSPGG